MKRLGELDLPDSLQWVNRWGWSPVAQEGARTLGGTQVIWSQALVGGQPIDLEAADGTTWLSLATVQTLQRMAAQPSAVFQLVWEGDVFQVRFRHQDAPAMDFRPIHPHATLFTGTVRLITL